MYGPILYQQYGDMCRDSTCWNMVWESTICYRGCLGTAHQLQCVCVGGGGLQNGVGGGASEVLPLYLTQELEVLPILRGHKTF